MTAFADASSFNADLSNWDVSQAIVGGPFHSNAYYYEDMFGYNYDRAETRGGIGVGRNDDPSGTATPIFCNHLPDGLPGYNARYACTTPPGVFIDGASLKAAVADVTTAEATHGPISGWDVSQVDDMNALFQNKGSFNADISKWDVASVTNMFGTFNGADAFNRPLVWDTSSVETLTDTFWGAGAFNQQLVWDTSSVEAMQYAFLDARAFNQPLAWDTSKVTNMEGTLANAEAFDQPLDWDTSKVTTFKKMLEGAEAFDRDLSKWDITGGVLSAGVLQNTVPPPLLPLPINPLPLLRPGSPLHPTPPRAPVQRRV